MACSTGCRRRADGQRRTSSYWIPRPRPGGPDDPDPDPAHHETAARRSPRGPRPRHRLRRPGPRCGRPPRQRWDRGPPVAVIPHRGRPRQGVPRKPAEPVAARQRAARAARGRPRAARRGNRADPATDVRPLGRRGHVLLRDELAPAALHGRSLGIDRGAPDRGRRRGEADVRPDRPGVAGGHHRTRGPPRRACRRPRHLAADADRGPAQSRAHRPADPPAHPRRGLRWTGGARWPAPPAAAGAQTDSAARAVTGFRARDREVLMIRILTRLTTRRPLAVLLVALALVTACAVLGRGVADHLASGGTEDPQSQSSHTAAVLDREFPGSRPNLLLLVSGRHGQRVDDPALLREGTELTQRLTSDHSVDGVTSYFGTSSPQLRSTDGRSALIVAHLTGNDDAVKRTFDRIAPEVRAGTTGLAVRLGGPAAVRDTSQRMLTEDLRRAELIALPITLLILVVVFGGLVAAALPIVVALVAVVGTSAVLRALTAVTDVSVFAQNPPTALALGLALDYSLFIVRRYREELAHGAEPRAALAATLQSAGRTVVFSALTVGVSLAAMLVFPLYFLRSFAYAGVSVVLIAALGAVLVLPAILAL